MLVITPANPSTARVSNLVVDDPDRRLLERFRRDGDRESLGTLLTTMAFT